MVVVAEAATVSPLITEIEPEYSLADADKMPRRIPVPARRPSLAQCQATGVVLDENSRVIVALDRGGVGKALVKRLEKLGVTVLVLDVSLDQAAVEKQIQSWLAEGPIQGVYWLTALDVEPDLTEMTLAAWQEANRVRVKNLSITMRQLYDVVSVPGRFLITATRLGGLHGYGPAPAVAPLGGSVTGFTKAYKRERPEVLVKTVDFEVSRKTAVFADQLLAETTSDPGCVEVGYWRNGRYTITLLEQPAADGQPGLTLTPNSVFLVTGAAGGITNAIVADLAAASGGTFYLLDLTPAPDPADPNIRRFRNDREGLKQQFIADMRAAGEKPLPPMIEKKLMAVERQDAALQAIEAAEKVGGTAVYCSLNLLDHAALTNVVAEIRDKFGRIDVLLHAGGIEISKGLSNKDAAQFDLVYDIKANGFYSLLHAAQSLPIGATVAFSSVAGRFGNAGQTDYSAANDLLCKISSSLRRTRPGTKAIAIDWTAWGGIGMATRGSIPKIMEMAGIEMLPPEAGIPTTRRELVAGGFASEVLVGGALGILVDEWHESGGLDLTRCHSPEGSLLIGDVTAASVYSGWQVATTLDPKAQPFLYDHAMDGTPLLPGVMGTEAFAQLAQMIVPEMQVVAVFNEDFHAPFKFYRMEPQTLYLRGTAVPDGDDVLVYAQLYSRRELRTGVQEKLHFSATVRLSKNRPAAEPAAFQSPPQLDIGPEAIYDIYFHGPAYQVLAGVQVTGNRAVGLWADELPPNLSPPDMTELIAPRLVELCFQTAGVWQIQTQHRLALPLAIGSVTAYEQEKEVNGRLYALVEAVNDDAEFKAQVVDEAGQVYVRLSGYRTVALPGEVSFSL